MQKTRRPVSELNPRQQPATIPQGQTKDQVIPMDNIEDQPNNVNVLNHHKVADNVLGRHVIPRTGDFICSVQHMIEEMEFPKPEFMLEVGNCHKGLSDFTLNYIWNYWDIRIEMAYHMHPEAQNFKLLHRDRMLEIHQDEPENPDEWNRKMQLTNKTNIPDKKIRKIIEFVKLKGVSKFNVLIQNCRNHLTAGSYQKGGQYRRVYYVDTISFNNLLSIGLQRYKNTQIVAKIWQHENDFPVRVKANGNYLSYILLSREEALVHVLAHELRHAWQTEQSLSRVWSANDKQSEQDCDAYAIRKTREWRRKNMTTVGLADWEAMLHRLLHH